MRNKLIKYVMSKGIRDQHVVETIVNDVLLKESAKGKEFAEARFRVLDYIRKANRESERYVSLDALSANSIEEPSSLYDIIGYDDTNERESRLQEDQRQLILNLANGSDERTTLIVQTFLTTDKPTVTTVAKRLGLDHKQVSRALTRLSRNYDSGLYGDLRSYFVA
ncbi:hypothetical protein LAU42_09140 [Macrococcus armenti]|uniref:hypothetical protein n=1 Tax=Macrococcus armenti TaxID=2875764 RepID=UPI001CCF5C5B|nr:hypothetical protein [Macrococcus armenti]UBH21929.1 hypothetical protein LAU42_09140 [Macrococcus armenti]